MLVLSSTSPSLVRGGEHPSGPSWGAGPEDVEHRRARTSPSISRHRVIQGSMAMLMARLMELKLLPARQRARDHDQVGVVDRRGTLALHVTRSSGRLMIRNSSPISDAARWGHDPDGIEAIEIDLDEPAGVAGRVRPWLCARTLARRCHCGAATTGASPPVPGSAAKAEATGGSRAGSRLRPASRPSSVCPAFRLSEVVRAARRLFQ